MKFASSAKTRFWVRWIGAAAGLLLAAAALLVFFVAGGSEGGDLSDAQWDRLLRQMTTHTATVALPAEAAGASLPQAAGTPMDTAAASAQSRGQLPGRRLAPSVLAADIRTRQEAEYAADRPKTVVELQQFRDRISIEVNDGAARRGTATLTNLNPRINGWYLLQIAWEGESDVRSYHLSNSSPQGQSLVLEPEFRQGLLVASTVGAVPCDLWSHDNPRRLDVAAARDTPYVMLCDEQLTLRLKTTGSRTTTEKVTDFLRDTLWGGEAITVFVRQTFYQDAFLSTAQLGGAANQGGAGAQNPAAPRAARLALQHTGRVLDRSSLGLSVEGPRPGRQAVGQWYPLRGNPGVFASTARPDLIAPDILASHTDIVVRLDDVELEALSYLVAFDLAEFDIAFSLGTDHPRLGWSDRVPEELRAAALPGPDGISSTAPLVATGIIPGALAARSVATFTGGFKRTHGGFRYAELSTTNHGSHYGFIEDGVVFSKLQPGLSTIYVLDDGSFQMKTWTVADNALLERVRYARQNGVPIIERSGDSGVPGAMVSRYGAGNWSGSQDGAYRTLRAGACLQETDGQRFLIYAYFSSATPSAMARVFQAYECSYAMLLDMNALEHTYMAAYSLRGADLVVEHLVRGMEVLDKSDGDRLLPRFLGFADNRDFFYVLRRDPARRRSLETGS